MMTFKFREWVIPLITLVVAVAALSYNAWRNERSEQNRNVRIAGFEIIKELSALQLVTNYAHYEKNYMQGNPITGWSQILLIEDLAMIMPNPVQQQAKKLHQQWETHIDSLVDNEQANETIIAEISRTRDLVIVSLKELH